MSDRKPVLAMPPDACDCHMHIYEPGYAEAPTAVRPTVPGRLSAYRSVMARLGIARAVIVQPTAYGFDNRCTLDAMATLGPAARGVAVVDPEAPDAELERLTRAGMRGIRFQMLPGGLLGWDQMERAAARVAEFGWHVQLQLDGRTLPEHRALLKRLPGTLVIDHVGKFLEPVEPDHSGVGVILDLLAGGRCWVKLSAPYEVSRTGPPRYADVGAIAMRLVAAAPERMLWASNWPHPSVPVEDAPDDADLLDLLLEWVPDPAARQRVLVDNPAVLYGF